MSHPTPTVLISETEGVFGHKYTKRESQPSRHGLAQCIREVFDVVFDYLLDTSPHMRATHLVGESRMGCNDNACVSRYRHENRTDTTMKLTEDQSATRVRTCTEFRLARATSPVSFLEALRYLLGR